MATHHTIIVGAGMAGLAAAIALSAKGESVTVVESRTYPGGKMRQIQTPGGGVDSGPTVFTMKYVFDELFDMAGRTVEQELGLDRTNILARHAWDDSGTFDLFTDRKESEDAIARFFGKANADGYRRFCADAENIFATLKDTYIGAQRPGPFELGRRVGLTRLPTLLALRPFTSLWNALGDYFPDARLQQLFGRYATYVGSSPFQSPATLMLIAHVEQEGVWFVEGGMHALARKMAEVAEGCGARFHWESPVAHILETKGRASHVELQNGVRLEGDTILFCGDASALANGVLKSSRMSVVPVPRNKRALSALTWSITANTGGVDLHRHNVFFSDAYKAEFDAIFKNSTTPAQPTVYVCAQDRQADGTLATQNGERLLCLTNAPAFGDEKRLTQEEMNRCEDAMFSTLTKCGLQVDRASMKGTITQPADFEALFPGSGGSLYGRAAHGWLASFARSGAKTAIPGLYLAGGSVHPGPGVPMATRSGMLAAEQILKDRALT
ncbi:1-hydroxycarotenoid 3,4-desaturase CrtD [Pseudahrensia aquimaris]|uniref:1-hydroxycarotenoid 3,4-desaturase CrtD n=1 Tax=Pseudahrensia aquimaris TaxID=744461 RepID=A0ABW3FM42_9HYPH